METCNVQPFTSDMELLHMRSKTRECGASTWRCAGMCRPHTIRLTSAKCSEPHSPRTLPSSAAFPEHVRQHTSLQRLSSGPSIAARKGLISPHTVMKPSCMLEARLR